MEALSAKGHRLLALQNLNVQTFSLLLEALVGDLKTASQQADQPASSHDMTQLLTTAIMTLLPALRQCSSWMTSKYRTIMSSSQHKRDFHVTRLLTLYVETMNILNQTFPMQRLPKIEYLLEEDTNVIGFLPLTLDTCQRRFLDDSGKIKPRPPPMAYSMVEEMFGRIRDLVDEARLLALWEVGSCLL